MGDWTGESHSTPALDFRVQKVILFELVISIPLAIAHSAIRLAGEKVFFASAANDRSVCVLRDRSHQQDL